MNKLILLLGAVLAVTIRDIEADKAHSGNNEIKIVKPISYGDNYVDPAGDNKPKENEIPPKKPASYRYAPIHPNNDYSTLEVNDEGYYSSVADRTGNYIALNRDQNLRLLQNFARILKRFEERYAGRLEGIHHIQDMVVASIVQNERVLNPVTLLDDPTKECVSLHRTFLLTEAYAKLSISQCLFDASSQINDLLHAAKSTLASMENYEGNVIEKEITKCSYDFTNYTTCVINVVYKSNDYFIENKKIFETQLDAAECIAKANVKTAFDCTYSVQKEVISLISKSNTLINSCIVDDSASCEPCDDDFACDKHTEVIAKDFKLLPKIPNPFHGNRNAKKACLMLKAIYD